MSRLSLFYPVKPVIITQGFGVFNPAYEPLGFTKHNGYDYLINPKDIAYAMCDGIIADAGYNTSAGNFVKLRTRDKVQVGDLNEWVCLMYMHGEKLLVERGQKVKAGDPIMVCDNTGFSTGYHLHISAFFMDEYGRKKDIGDKDADYCFDFVPYYNRYYAVYAQKVISILWQILALLQKALNK